MQPVFTLTSDRWDATFPTRLQEGAVQALEEGKVLFLPRLAFPLQAHELEFLAPEIVAKSKNVSFDPASGEVGGTGVAGMKLNQLRELLGRYAAASRLLLDRLVPGYRDGLR